jgi:hypothetical protein
VMRPCASATDDVIPVPIPMTAMGAIKQRDRRRQVLFGPRDDIALTGLVNCIFSP